MQKNDSCFKVIMKCLKISNYCYRLLISTGLLFGYSVAVSATSKRMIGLINYSSIIVKNIQ